MSAANILTLSRLVLAFPIAVLIYRYQPWAAWTAFGLFIAAMLTDVFDGMLAKREPNRSPLGNYLDPVADKVLLMTAFICLAHLDILPVWMVVVVVAREFIVNGVRAAGAVQGRLVGANWMGKVKTVLQTVAISFALGGRALAITEGPSDGLVVSELAQLCSDIAWWVMLAATIAAVAFAGVFLYWNRSLWRAGAADRLTDRGTPQ